MLIVMTLAVALTTAFLIDAARLDPGPAWVEQYHYTTDPAARLLTFGDGQFYGMIAQDPTLSRPEAIIPSGDRAGELAYRAMRPGFAWGAWALSLGRPELVPAVLIVLTAGSVAVLYEGVRRLAAALGRDPRVAAAAIMLPGVVRLLGWTGPEIAAAGAACLAVAAAARDEPRRAAGILVIAVLLRESLLLVALGLFLSGRMRARQAVVPLAALLGWATVVCLRLGTRPADGQRLELLGLLEAAIDWGTFEWLSFLLLGVLMAVTARQGRFGAALVAPHLAMLLVMAPITGVLEGFSRIMLPMYALGLAFAAPAARPRGTDAPVTPVVAAA
ncbi:MAG: hypothetical protein KGZ72_10300 [Roseovarius sp.]|nr:hypothetical protein [Roseovarius sp.]